MIKYSQIKDINSDNFNQAINIYKDAFPDNEKLTIETLKVNISDHKLQLFIGCEEAKVIFMAILCPLINTNFTLLAYVATDENYRGKGIGKEFMEYLAIELKNQEKFLLLEVENPTLGENQKTKQRRVNFYQRLGAKTMKNIRHLLPKLSEEEAPEMILMVYPSYQENFIEGDLVKNLIISVYEQFYQQYSHPNLDFLLKNIPDKINLI